MVFEDEATPKKLHHSSIALIMETFPVIGFSDPFVEEWESSQREVVTDSPGRVDFLFGN